MPIPGKRVLVTRAAHQASALADALAARGLTAILIPTIAIEPPTDEWTRLRLELERLDSFDWLVFTSANAVEAFAREWEEASGEALPCRIASIGAATSRAVRAAGFEVDLQPSVAVAEDLARALVPHAPSRRFLLIRAESARDVLPESLRRASGDVVIAPAYRTVVPQESVAALRRELPRLHAVTFTSASSVRNLFELCDAAAVTLPPKVALASIGPITSDALRLCGYAPTVEASTADVEVLASELARFLARS